MDTLSTLNVLKEIQSELIDSSTIERYVQHDGKYYLLLSIRDDLYSAGEAVVEVSEDGSYRILALDSYVDAETQVPSGASLATIGLKQPGLGDDPPDLPPSPTVPDGTKSEKVGFVAEHFLGILSSRLVPGTDSGNKACAWATNYVIRVALGDGLGSNIAMLSTIRMFKALDSGKGNRIEIDQAGRGDIIISPTGSRIGHVGILLDGSRIANNSSTPAMWVVNKTKLSWRQEYVLGKKLMMFAFRLI